MWAAIGECKSACSPEVQPAAPDHSPVSVRRSHSAIGVHSVSGARAADIMPTWPSGGRSTVAPRNAAASGSAEPGGTMRSRLGQHDERGSARELRIDRLAGDLPPAAAGPLSPYQERAHSRATGGASGTPSLIQSSSATKAARRVAVRVERGEADEFALGRGTDRA